MWLSCAWVSIFNKDYLATLADRYTQIRATLVCLSARVSKIQIMDKPSIDICIVKLTISFLVCVCVCGCDDQIVVIYSCWKSCLWIEITEIYRQDFISKIILNFKKNFILSIQVWKKTYKSLYVEENSFFLFPFMFISNISCLYFSLELNSVLMCLYIL